MRSLFAFVTLFFFTQIVPAQDSPVNQSADSDSRKHRNLQLPHYPVRFMLNDSLVAGQLSLSDAIRKKILTITQDRLARITNSKQIHRRQIKQLGPGDTKELQAKHERLARTAHSEQKSQIASLEAELDRLLTTQQRLRLQQINMQLIGYDGLIHPQIVQALEFSQEQMLAIGKHRIDAAKQGRALRNRAKLNNFSDDELNRELEETRRRSHRKIEAVLSGEQRREFQRLCGKPINFTRSELQLSIPLTLED